MLQLRLIKINTFVITFFTSNLIITLYKENYMVFAKYNYINIFYLHINNISIA